MKQFVIFSLNAHVSPFVKTELQILDALSCEGNRLSVLKPAGCTCRLVENVNKPVAAGEQSCERCQLERSIFENSRPGVNVETLTEYADPEDEKLADSLTISASFDDLTNLTFRGVKVGKMALYDIILGCKACRLEALATGQVFQDYKALVRVCILLEIRFFRYLEANPVSAVLTYNSNYTINNIITEICLLSGIPSFSMHGGISHSRVWETLILTASRISTFWKICAENWNDGFSNRPLNTKEVTLVGEHFSELFKGQASHAYSASVDSASCDPLMEAASLGGMRRVILAATSSADEVFALESSGIRDFPKDQFLFESQVGWIEFLISRAKENQDVALIIRVHPREFPNKRENVTSAQAVRLLELLKDVPENVFINWPSDNISLYQLAVRTDLVLSCWSSALLEVSGLGCPIVLPQNPVSIYESVADESCTDRDIYWEKVRAALGQEWSLERVIQTFRWIWFLQFGGVVSLESDQNRKRNLKELLQEVPGLIKKRIGRNIIKGPTVFEAFNGDYRQIVNRPTNVRGRTVLQEVLTKSPGLSTEFRKIRKMQGDRDGIEVDVTGQEEERDAIIGELKRIARILGAAASPSVPNKFSKLMAGINA